MKSGLGWALLAVSSFAQTGAQTGPDPGTTVPAFEAADQNGAKQTLHSVMGPKGALLVFFRSADWCPFCKGQLVELQRSLEGIRAQGLGLAAISYDSVAVLKNFADRQKITFPLLSDVDSKIIKAFGILNQSALKDKQFAGIPNPGTYLVDPQGVVVAKYFEKDFRERDTAAEILTQRFGSALGAPHETHETKHLTVSTSASAKAVRRGQMVSLIIDVELKPGMHVYAPGVEGYIPIDWSMAPNEAFRAGIVEFPASHQLRLPVIDETVPVFTGKFRLMRTITAAGDGKPGELTAEGTLRYQACDERMCYLPVSVPMKWSLRYEALDRERVPAELQRKP